MKILLLSILISATSFATPLPTKKKIKAKLNVSSKEVTVKFKNAGEAEEFMRYMCGQGEQDMGLWMSHNLPELDRLPKYDYEKNLIDYTK